MLKSNPDLNLHLEVSLKGGEQHEESRQRQLKHLRYTGYTILGQGHAQILLDGCDKYLERKKEGRETHERWEEKEEEKKRIRHGMKVEC